MLISVRLLIMDQSRTGVLMQGSWIVKQAVGSPTVLMGQIMELGHHVTDDYIEVGVSGTNLSYFYVDVFCNSSFFRLCVG